MTNTRFLSTTEVALLLGVSPIRVRQFIEQERLAAIRIGGRYAVRADEAARFQALPRPGAGWKKGRPRGKKQADTA